MKARRLFNNASKLASDIKIKSIAAISLDTLPLYSISKLLSACDKINRHVLLARTNKNHNMKVVTKATQIDLLNVFEVDQ